MRAGNDDRARAPEKVIADGLGQRAVPDLPVQHFLELGVAAGDRVADDDKIQVGADVLRLESLEGRDLLFRQEVAHRRVDVLVRAADVEALALEHRSQRRHGRAAHANQVDPLHSSRAIMRPPPPR